MKKNMLTFRTLLIGLICIAALVGLGGCASDDPAGTALDRMLWEMRGFPSQEEILEHLQEKYGEEFVLVDLNSGARFFQGVAYPASNPEMVFSLEMKDEDGNSMPIQYMRDDYQARLAEHYITQQIQPLIDRQFGTNQAGSIRVEVALFDRLEDFNLPASFEWTPSDGLEHLAENDGVNVQLAIHVTVENAASFADFDSLATSEFLEKLVRDAAIPFSGDMSIRAADSNAHYLLTWEAANGELGESWVEFSEGE